MILKLLLLIALFLAALPGPGFFLLRRLDLDDHERLAASIGLSITLIYSASFLIYVAGIPVAAHWAVLAACLALTAACARPLLAFVRKPAVAANLGWYAFLALLGLALASLIRNYSGGGWYGDWLEHYQRSLFFIDRPSVDTIFQGQYALPARPPLMNVVCAWFMSLAGREYAVFQAAATLLGATIWFPAVLVVRLIRDDDGERWSTLALFIACNPMLVQNITYSWTKLPTAFFVVTGVCLYIAGWRRSDPGRQVAALGALAAGSVTHYSAAPYALFLGAHFLIRQLGERRLTWKLPAAAGLLIALIAGPWLGWSLLRFGSGTFTTTSTVADTSRLQPGENAAKIGRNIRNSIVPHVARGVEMEAFRQGIGWGAVRDAAFKLYQSNLIFGFGSAGFGLLCFQILSSGRSRGSRRPPPSPAFLALFVSFCVVIGIAVHGAEDNVGLAHICLQPLVLMGTAALAAWYGTWTRKVRAVALTGLGLDLLLGIALHFRFQAITFGGFSEGAAWGLKRADILVGSLYANWKLKENVNVAYLADQLGGGLWMAALAAAGCYLLLAALTARGAGPAPGRARK